MLKSDVKIVFIIRAIGNHNKYVRVLSSIIRQTNCNYEIVTITNNKTIRKNYSNDSKIVFIKDKKNFCKALFKEIKLIDDNDYVIVVNNNEIVAPNTVQSIIYSNSDVAIFNISKLKGLKFAPVFSLNKELTISNYVKNGARIWNNAIKAKLIKSSAFKMDNLSYTDQLLYLLSCYSIAETINVSNKVLFYTEKLKGIRPINYTTFYDNRKALGKILKTLKNGKSDDSTFLYEFAINEFIVPQLVQLSAEKSFIKRLRIKIIIGKHIGIL